MLKLHNSLTRSKSAFEPISPDNVRLYVCGPTVYDYAHIGNARSAVVFDLLRHVLTGLFPRVTLVRNVTDIDDKIMARAAAAGESVESISERFHAAYSADMAALGISPPDVEPKATAHIPEIITMIGDILHRGHAYHVSGHVYFDVSSAPQGKLALHTDGYLRADAAGRGVDAGSKRTAADFVLWKPSSENQPGWDSPWGRGRPGWHIECSAMAARYLGKVFDIHGGGADLAFPHHENEIRQSTCAHGTKEMARWFIHNAMVTLAGRKLAKSEGTSWRVRDLLDRHTGAEIRFALLSTHYRKPLNLSDETLPAAAAALDGFRRVIEQPGTGGDASADDVREALLDDLNTPLAIARLHAHAARGDSGRLADGLRIMGVDPRRPPASGEGDEWIRDALQARTLARVAGNWPEADRLRRELAAAGIVLEDGPSGTTWRTS